MRTYTLRIGLCLATLTVSALALPMTAAAQPPAPDLAAMALQPGDFPYGAKLTQPDLPLREFDVGDRASGRRVQSYASQLLVADDSAETARTDMALVKRLLASRRGRLLLARQLVKGTGRRSGLKATDVRFAPLRTVRAGDSAFVLRFTVARLGRSVVFAQGYMAAGQVETIVTLAGRKHSQLRTRLVSLMRTAAGRIGTAQPVISGTAGAGQTLSASTGSWDPAAPPAAFGYVWLRCDAAGSACAPIAGATGASYTVTPQDAGATLRVKVTASNADGSAVELSSPTGVVG